MQQGNKRVAFVHDDFPFGGAERVTMDIANYLSSFDYDVYIFTGTYYADRLPANIPIGFNVIELPEPCVSKSEKDAVCMIDHIKKMSISILVAAVRELKYIQMIVESTHCKYVFAHHGTPFWEAQIKLDMARKRGYRSWSNRLEWYFLSYPKYIWFKKHEKQFHRIYQSTYALTDRYTVLCEEYRSELVRSLGLDPQNNKIRVIPNSEKRIEHPNLNKRKQVLFVGRLSYSDKRVDRLIDIWEKVCNRVPEWELIIVGDGEERENLENKVSRAKLPRIRFEGATTNVQPYYDEASVLCLVSTFEGWGLCLTEAQVNAVVPVAFDCSAGVRKIVSPSGTNGLLVPPFDLDCFAETLVELLNDPQRLETMRHNVLKKSEEYAVEVVGRKWMDLFEELFREIEEAD